MRRRSKRAEVEGGRRGGGGVGRSHSPEEGRKWERFECRFLDPPPSGPTTSSVFPSSAYAFFLRIRRSLFHVVTPLSPRSPLGLLLSPPLSFPSSSKPPSFLPVQIKFSHRSPSPLPPFSISHAPFLLDLTHALHAKEIRQGEK